MFISDKATQMTRGTHLRLVLLSALTEARLVVSTLPEFPCQNLD